MRPPHATDRFGRQVAGILESTLGADLVGVYFVGSIALGGYVNGQSDIDITAVCRRRPAARTKQALAGRLLEATAGCPARGLEFTLYRAEVVSSLPRDADFELNVNGGPRMDREVRLHWQGQPRFWYVLDRAVAHRHGMAIVGRPAAEVFLDIPRATLLDDMGESMRWHREHEKATLYSVLNACRAWRFAVDNILGSKRDGARWARSRWGAPSLIDAAVRLRHGHPARLDAAEVDAFLVHVEGVLSNSAHSYRADPLSRHRA